MATEEIPLEGRRLAGRYLLEEEVASGGMGAVWRARDEVLGRAVAVKILHDRLARDPGVLERFRLEAVAAARLSHPCVVRVFDTGVDDGVCYIVMELFSGKTLAEILQERGPLSPAEAAALVRSALQGLGHAHRAGVVHRDVKPRNILVDAGGHVKVTDFGIAKAAFSQDDLTTTGNLLGTARYLAPEQVAGGEVDARADLYSAGVVLYELLTGRAPFEANTHIATATMRMTKSPPSPRALRPGIPRALDEITMTALAREPDARFQTAEEMAAALDRGAPAPLPAQPAHERGEPEPDPRRSGLRPWITIPLVLALMAAAAVGLYSFLEGGRGSAPPNGPQETAADALDLTTAVAYDPIGADGEHDEEAPAAVDGQLETFWQTEGYNSSGMDKDGVGLVIPLPQETEIGAVRIRSETPGWQFQLFVGPDSEAVDVTTPLASVDGDDTFFADEAETVRLDATSAGYVLIWLTELPSVQGDYRAYVNEVDVYAAGG